jgi:hypothetical protein
LENGGNARAEMRLSQESKLVNAKTGKVVPRKGAVWRLSFLFHCGLKGKELRIENEAEVKSA